MSDPIDVWTETPGFHCKAQIENGLVKLTIYSEEMTVAVSIAPWRWKRIVEACVFPKPQGSYEP